MFNLVAISHLFMFKKCLPLRYVENDKPMLIGENAYILG